MTALASRPPRTPRISCCKLIAATWAAGNSFCSRTPPPPSSSTADTGAVFEWIIKRADPQVQEGTDVRLDEKDKTPARESGRSAQLPRIIGRVAGRLGRLGIEISDISGHIDEVSAASMRRPPFSTNFWALQSKCPTPTRPLIRRPAMPNRSPVPPAATWNSPGPLPNHLFRTSVPDRIRQRHRHRLFRSGERPTPDSKGRERHHRHRQTDQPTGPERHH